MQSVAEARSITKRYGSRTVVDGFSFSASAGQATALLGPNGAGKTTALEILQGLRKPDAGSARLFGLAPTHDRARKRIGVTLQGVDFPEHLTAAEVIGFACAHYDEPQDAGALSAAFGLEGLMERRMGGFSGGEKRRVALALAFAGKPDLVFLDEPTTGLDDRSQTALRAHIRDYVASGGSVILTSHYWPEIEEIADRIVMIDAGRKVLEGGVEEIREAAGMNRVRFAAERMEPWMADFQRDGQWFSTVTSRSDELVRRLSQSGAGFSRLTVEGISLREAIAAFQAGNHLQGEDR